MALLSRVVRSVTTLSLLLCCVSPAAGQTDRDLLFEPAPVSRHLDEQMLLDMARADERLVAVGASGLVILSDDHGASWRQARVPVSATLTAVDFPTPQLGWAVGHGGVILHSRDGGETWALQFDGNRANSALLDFANEQRVRVADELETLQASDPDADDLEAMEYALDDAYILVDDAELAIETGPADPFLDVRFMDERRGFAVGAYGLFFSTDDAGEHWEIAMGRIENPERFHYYQLHRASTGDLFIAGEAGLLFHSSDGGERFERFYDVYDGSLFGLVELGTRTVAFGLRGNLFEFGDGRWQPLNTDNKTSLYGGGRLADGSAVLVGAGGTVMNMAPTGENRIGSHASRSTFSGAIEAADGSIWLYGKDGLAQPDEDAAP